MEKVLVTGGSGFIGIHLVDYLDEIGYQVANIDLQPPINTKHLDKWTQLSILNFKDLQIFMNNFQPNYIVHLAAVTTQDATSLNEFNVNITGTQNLLEISEKLDHLEKFIFASSQYAVTPGSNHDLEKPSKPYGLYGESKLIGEELTKCLLVSTSWTIIRPATIWGPWHTILSKGLWNQIDKRKYLHPLTDNAIKGYGFVKNSAWQIGKILTAPKALTDHETFYIGDENLKQSVWVKEFHKSLTGKDLRYVPNALIFILSEIGELLLKIGVTPPIFRSRFRNLVTSNPVPLEKTLTRFGKPPTELKDAVRETVLWCTWYSRLKANRSNKQYDFDIK
jgi:nucleoside-diphosphate-sugar epimerase